MREPRLYDTYFWETQSREFRRTNPFCKFCELRGETCQAEVVDHIIPHRGDKALFFDLSNWQSLCAHCHNSAKKQVESRGYHDQMDWRGLPIDPNHPFNRVRS